MTPEAIAQPAEENIEDLVADTVAQCEADGISDYSIAERLKIRRSRVADTLEALKSAGRVMGREKKGYLYWFPQAPPVPDPVPVSPLPLKRIHVPCPVDGCASTIIADRKHLNAHLSKYHGEITGRARIALIEKVGLPEESIDLEELKREFEAEDALVVRDPEAPVECKTDRNTPADEDVKQDVIRSRALTPESPHRHKCTEPGCKRSFTALGHLINHLVKEHGMDRIEAEKKVLSGGKASQDLPIGPIEQPDTHCQWCHEDKGTVARKNSHERFCKNNPDRELAPGEKAKKAREEAAQAQLPTGTGGDRPASVTRDSDDSREPSAAPSSEPITGPVPERAEQPVQDLHDEDAEDLPDSCCTMAPPCSCRGCKSVPPEDKGPRLLISRFAAIAEAVGSLADEQDLKVEVSAHVGTAKDYMQINVLPKEAGS